MRYSLPKNDSLPFLFTLKDASGVSVVLNPGFVVTLTIKDSAGTVAFTAVATFDSTTVARAVITPAGLAVPGSYSGSIRGVSATEAHTYTFDLVVTDY